VIYVYSLILSQSPQIANSNGYFEPLLFHSTYFHNSWPYHQAYQGSERTDLEKHVCRAICRQNSELHWGDVSRRRGSLEKRGGTYTDLDLQKCTCVTSVRVKEVSHQRAGGLPVLLYNLHTWKKKYCKQIIDNKIQYTSLHIRLYLYANVTLFELVYAKAIQFPVKIHVR